MRPMTAFRDMPPIISAIWEAVFPLPHNSFNFATFSSVQLIITICSINNLFKYNIMLIKSASQVNFLIYQQFKKKGSTNLTIAT